MLRAKIRNAILQAPTTLVKGGPPGTHRGGQDREPEGSSARPSGFPFAGFVNCPKWCA
jgi:hypothetical protein